MRDARCAMRDARCAMRDAGCLGTETRRSNQSRAIRFDKMSRQTPD
jgi:hypothetical protein